MIEGILEKAHRGMGKVVFDPDPMSLFKKVVALIDKEEKALED